MPVIIDGTNGLTFPDNSRQYNGYFGFKNRIINGDMRIDQRNNGAAVTVNGNAPYTLDRYFAQDDTDGVFTIQQSSVAPSGFTNSMLFTVTTADASLGATQLARIVQRIEGFNTADLGWGTASAQTVTVSFWVRSSVTGTFGGSLANSAANRSYPFSYSISAANTWEQKSITIAGDTSGTWLTNNGIGIELNISLATGSTYSGTAGAWSGSLLFNATGATNLMATNGATFYITGVQLEEGVVSTNFDVLPYGTQLQLCQRYLPAFNATAINQTLPFSGCGVNATTQAGVFIFEVPTRTPPTGVTVSAASHFTNNRPAAGVIACTAVNFAASSNYACQIELKAASGLVADVPYLMYANNASAIMLFTGCEL